MRYREKDRAGYAEYKNRIPACPAVSQVPQLPQPTDRPKIGNDIIIFFFYYIKLSKGFSLV